MRRLDDLSWWRLFLLNCLLRLTEKWRRARQAPDVIVRRCRERYEIEKPHLEPWP